MIGVEYSNAEEIKQREISITASHLRGVRSDYACVGILEEGREERGKVVVAGVDLEIEIPP